MQDETLKWLNYSKENLDSAEILLEHELYNACLQNVQQCVEKSLKAFIIEKGISFKKTHNTLDLKIVLEQNGCIINLTEEECDFLDSIYLPSKYPIGSA